MNKNLYLRLNLNKLKMINDCIDNISYKQNVCAIIRMDNLSFNQTYNNDQELKEMDFKAFVLNPATLLVIVFGLVEFVKQFGVRGKRPRILSLGLGISIAASFKAREMVPEWALWIELGFFGLAVGLAASGIYGFIDNRFPEVGR
jgi:hypothetical protein